MKVKFFTIQEYSKEFGLPEAMVREMTKRKEPPFEIEWSGTKAYIKVFENKEETELRKEVEYLSKMVLTMCKHFGVNTDSLELETGKAVS